VVTQIPRSGIRLAEKGPPCGIRQFVVPGWSGKIAKRGSLCFASLIACVVRLVPPHAAMGNTKTKRASEVRATYRMLPLDSESCVRRTLASPAPAMLLCLSSREWRSVLEEAVEAAGEVALEAAVCFASGLAFLHPSFDVGDRRGV
jgi:hypothetical protein